jgi:hypothetical protein
MNGTNDYRSIKEAVDKIQIVDTHEHLVQEKERVKKSVDIFEIFLSHYASSDLVSSGMPLEELAKLRNRNIPLEKRFAVFKPFWDRIQNTGYARAINIAVRDLYGFDGIKEDTFKKLALKMDEMNKPGLYNWILKEKSGIKISILDSLDTVDEVDREFFAPVARFDGFVTISNRMEIEELGKACGKAIHSFNDLVQALESEFERASKDIVGVKIGLAYMRDLRFDKVSEGEAEEVFANIYKQRLFKADGTPEGVSPTEARPYQDFMVHKIIQLAAKKRLPVQIHTGLQEGNENVITNSEPTLLINLFREYKEVKFDVFHGSYPYTGELAALAKNFQNVYIDMCWLHVISPFWARQALADWLDVVPWNKILGFGGDYIFAEGVYGHSVIARENIARVLAEKVEDGALTGEQAINLARGLLRDNAYDLFFGKASCGK